MRSALTTRPHARAPRGPAAFAAWCALGDTARQWLRCGSAHVHPDGSIGLYLDALPLTGEVVLRPEPAAADDQPAPAAPVPLHD